MTLNESITALIKSEPKTEASRQARKMGLTYLGFGRYAGPDGNVSHIVVKDKLVPFKKDEELAKMMAKAGEEETRKAKEPPSKDGKPVKKSNTPSFSDVKKLHSAKSLRNREDKKILSSKKKEISDLDNELSSFYGGVFNDDEMDAIEWYTSNYYEDINSYLYNGHAEGTDYNTAKFLENIVDRLDQAFEETEAPFQYTTYTGLGTRYNAENFEIGREYIFKGYVSSSLDHEVAAGVFTDYKKDGKSGGKSKSANGIMLELEIPKGAKSIYIGDQATVAGEYETLLPRGTRIKVVSGPHITKSSTLLTKFSDDPRSKLVQKPDTDLIIFKCKVVKDDV